MWAVVLALLLALGGTPTAAVAQAPLSPNVAAYLPVVLQSSSVPGVPGSFATSVTLYAYFARTNFFVDVFQPDGTRVLRTPPIQAARLQSRQVYLPSISDLPPGRYTAIVYTDSAGFAVVTNLLSPNTALATSYPGPTHEGDSGQTVAVPGVFKNYLGRYSSTVSVQNATCRTADDVCAAASVSVAYRDASGSTVATSGPQTVPANGVFDFVLGAAAVPDGFVGSATVTSDQPVVAVAQVVDPSGQLGATVGVPPVPTSSITPLPPSPDLTAAFLPQIYKNYSADGWISSVLVQNLDAAAAAVELTFTGAGLAAPITLSDTIAPGAAKQYWQGNRPAGLPDGFVGSVVVRSTDGRKIAPVTNTSNGRGDLDTSAAFPGPPANQPTGVARDYGLHFPALYNDYSPQRFVSSFLLQNVDTIASAVTVTYTDAAGATVAQVGPATLQPGQTQLRYLPAEAGIPVGFHGAAAVRTSGGRVVGVANVLALGQPTGDWMFTYEGPPGNF